MLVLTELLGQELRSPEGKSIGKVEDLVVRVGDEFPPVCAIVAKESGRRRFVEWDKVRYESGHLTLQVEVGSLTDYQSQETDLLLRQEVLDKQILNMSDYRVVRVSDVVLASGNGQLRLIGVDAGLRGLLRRLGLERLGDFLARRLHLTLHTHVLAWNQVELLKASGGKLRLKVPQSIAQLHPADIAEIINQLDPAQRTSVLDSLDVETAADTLAEVEPEVQVSIIEALPEERAGDLLEEMEPDEAADLLGDLSKEKSEDLLDEMEPEEAADVRELLAYADETAGGMMTTEYVAVPSHLTAAQAIDYLREHAEDAETIYYVYVVNDVGQLLGVFSLRDLLLAPTDSRVDEFMERDVVTTLTDAAPEDVAGLIERYDLLALPVVTEDHTLEGIVTFDDVVEVVMPEEWKRKLPHVFRHARSAKRNGD